jgi:hypothetical protein
VFKLTSNPAGVEFFSEPANVIEIGDSVTSATFYFVAGLGFNGEYTSEADFTVAGETVAADSRTLYKGILDEGTLTISKVSA